MKAAHDCQTLDDVRVEIDRLDREIVNALSQRRAYVYAAIQFKENEVELQGRDRREEVLTTRRLWAEEEGEDPDVVEALFRLIVDHFISSQHALVSERGGLTAFHQSSSTAGAVAGGCGDESDS